MTLILALIGGLLVAGEGLFYIRGIMRGSTRPHPFTWGLWTALGAIGFAAAFVGGGGIGLIPLGTLMVENFLIFIFTLRQNHPGEQRVSPLLLLIASVGVIGWLLSNTPAIASISVVIADSMGLIPTLKKTWRDPSSEPAWLWGISALAMALGLASLQHFTLASTLFPAYIVVANCGVVGLALRHNRSVVK
jgi:hypothetical protein